MIAKIVGFKGNIVWDKDKPDGTPRKVLNVEKIHHRTGWKHKTSLKDGLTKTYDWFLENQNNIRT